MLLVHSSQVALKCGVLLQKTDALKKQIQDLKPKFQFIHTDLIIEYKNQILIFLKISYCKVDAFSKSEDYLFLKDKLNVEPEEEQKEEEIQSTLSKHKNSITLLPSPRNKSSELECYYCGYLTGCGENIVYKLFKRKLIKSIDINQLVIYGVDYITNNAQNSYFTLPDVTVDCLFKSIEGEDTTKTPYSIKNDLYPYLLVNALVGVGIYKVEAIDKFSLVNTSPFGAASLWSLLNLACGYTDPDEAANDAIKGTNQSIDLTVGDIYGSSYAQFGLSSDLIASFFGSFKNVEDVSKVDKKNIARSLVTMYGNSVSQITVLVSKDIKVDKGIIFGNPFENAQLNQLVQWSVNFYSKNQFKPLFNIYAEYLDIIGICIWLDKEKKFDFSTSQNN